MALSTDFQPSYRKFIAKTIGAEDFQIISLAGDASTRRYFRIVANNTSFVLMMWEPFLDDGKYPFLNVRDHFEKHGVQVPKVVGKAPTLGLVLLEDLGDLTLERKFWESQNPSMALPFYKQAIDELIKIHFAATRDSSAGCVAFSVDFNVEKLLWEMNYGFEHLIERFCKIQLPAEPRQEIEKVFIDICTLLHEQPKVICHRDYHSRNVMLKLGQTRVIDFQDARMGPLQYDLVSLVHDSYVDLDDPTRQAILEYYLAHAREHLWADFSLDEFYSVFRLQVIQRCFKACGSFASFYNMREDRRYLKYLRPTIQKVARTLEQYSDYSVFSRVLQDHGLLERDYQLPQETIK